MSLCVPVERFCLVERLSLETLQTTNFAVNKESCSRLVSVGTELQNIGGVTL